jgi:zinc D-Ala-D-Ala carboxypeptidase
MDPKTKISEKFTLADVVRSQTAVQMKYDEQFAPPQPIIEAATLLCQKILDRIPIPFSISSFYRCERLNKRIGGSLTSDHRLGRSADIDTQNNANNANIFNWIKAHCEFDQLIWEFGNDEAPDWVHVSYRKNGCRNQVLRAIRENGRVKYITVK